MRRAASGELQLHGRPVTDLVDSFGTPVFLLDEDDLRGRARAYATAFEGADVYDASKAFSSITLLRWVAKEGLGLDVVTEGELAVRVVRRRRVSGSRCSCA